MVQDTKYVTVNLANHHFKVHEIGLIYGMVHVFRTYGSRSIPMDGNHTQ